MENPTRKRKAYGVSQALSVSLLIAGVAGAGLLAFLTRGENLAPKKRAARSAAEDRGDEVLPLALPQGARSSDGPSEAPATPPELAPSAAERLKEIEVPTVARALDLRLPRVEPRRDIVEHGVLALLPTPRCKPPAELVEAGRAGEGVYGCVVETRERQPYAVGRAAFRKASGNLEVGDHEDGKRTGEWREYYPTGVLASVGSFEGGQRDGVWHEYDETGEHRFSRSYASGRKHGVVIRYLGDTAELDLYFEGGKYDPESREPISQTFVAEVP